MLKVENARCGYALPGGGEKTVLQNLSFAVEAGEVLCVLGVNGVGKSTLFKSLLGSIPLLAGGIAIDGRDAAALTRKERALRMGYVPQFHTPPFPYTVEEVVVMGRVAHMPLYASPSARDKQIAAEALDTLGISHLAEEVYTEISGGERQMALIARALAQQAGCILMDEPTSNLDLHNQTLVLRQVLGLARADHAVLLTTHHPSHALLCASRVLILRGGGEYRCGPPEELLTEETLREMFGVEVALVQTTAPDGRRVTSVVSYL